MEITLEKIELVKDRTGVSYKVAKEALEAANGSVIDAIINIEEGAGIPESAEEAKVRSAINDNELFSKIKETSHKLSVNSGEASAKESYLRGHITTANCRQIRLYDVACHPRNKRTNARYCALITKHTHIRATEMRNKDRYIYVGSFHSVI
jgi:hypothetical protein